MPLVSKLLQWERTAEYIGIAANYLILIGSRISDKVEEEKQKGVTFKPAVDPTWIIASAVWLALISRIWLGRIAVVRLNYLKDRKRRGLYKGTLGPNNKITNGYLILIIGTIMVAVGSQQRADTTAQVTII